MHGILVRVVTTWQGWKLACPMVQGGQGIDGLRSSHSSQAGESCRGSRVMHVTHTGCFKLPVTAEGIISNGVYAVTAEGNSVAWTPLETLGTWHGMLPSCGSGGSICVTGKRGLVVQKCRVMILCPFGGGYPQLHIEASYVSLAGLQWLAMCCDIYTVIFSDSLISCGTASGKADTLCKLNQSLCTPHC